MSTEENEKKETRPRKVARSASTTDHPGFKPGEGPPPAEGAADGQPTPAASPAKSERRWDVRAERREGARPARPARPRRSFEAREGGPRPSGDPEMPQHRPGASGGRASPELPRRGPVDRASADFVDRWLTSKPKPRPERPFGDRPEGERRDGRPGDRGGRPDRGPRGAGAPAPSRPAAPAPAAPPAAAKKLPTLHETILVGLPKVATHHPVEKSAAKPKTAREAIAAKTAVAPRTGSDRPAVKAEVTLRPEWLAANASNAVSSLVDAGEAAEKLVDAWTQANNAAAIVEAAHADAAPSGARKAAKRSMNVLRARHVPLPERSAAKPAVSAEEEEVIEATFTPPDARGTVSFTISKRQGTNRAHIAEVIVREQMGVLQAVSAWMSRSQIKEAHQRVADASGIPPVTVPAEWARYRIAEARKENSKSGALVPLGLDKCKELVEPVPTSAPPHPIATFEAETRDDAAAGTTAALHSEPEFRAWLPDGAALDELLRKVGEAMSAEESKEEGKVDEVLKTEIKSATDRYFTPEVRAIVARRLRDAALSVRQRAGDAKAREVIHVARAVEKAGLITSPPHEIEFLQAFFQKGISFLAQRGGGQLRVPVGR